VKVGNGAFCATPAQARELARSLVAVARGAGLPTVALVTGMDQVLGHTAGNALEVREAIDFLTGTAREPRLLELTLALCAQLLHLGGLFGSVQAAAVAAQRALDDGSAAERFARMVAALGGPRDVLHDAQLAPAPAQRAVPAPHAGVLRAMDTRALGRGGVSLGGGRSRPGEAIDPRVGLSALRPLGTSFAAGEPIACVHAASEGAAEDAVRQVLAALRLQPPDGALEVPAGGAVASGTAAGSVVHETIE
jgi:thymidine phosphorylase